MRSRWLVALALLVAACGGDDDDDAAPATTVTTTSTTAAPTTTTDPDDGTCDDFPPFGTTWLPEMWEGQYFVAGSGGDDTRNCGVHHLGGDGRYLDVRPGDGGQAFGPLGSRTITVLGRPAEIGPIHEGVMVQTGTHALLGYGIDEDVLERIATGLYPFGPPAAPEVGTEQVPDGLHAGRIVEVGDGTVTVDLIGWYSGEEANRVARERGEEEVPVPNDYYTVNDDPATTTLPVDAEVVVTSPWAEYGSDGCELCQRVITLERLRELFTGPQPEAPEGNVRHDPFWLTVVDGRATRLDEQYVP